jgi:hemerythrin-like metal-binding protein
MARVSDKSFVTVAFRRRLPLDRIRDGELQPPRSNKFPSEMAGSIIAKEKQMSLMTWDKNLETGHAGIDSDHKKLVNLVNQLADAMASGRGKDVCGKVLAELAAYTATHFAMEERLMAAQRYSKAVEHKGEHDKLVKEVLAFKAKFDAGSAMLTLSLLTFLKEWLGKHILGSDKALVAELAKKAA